MMTSYLLRRACRMRFFRRKSDHILFRGSNHCIGCLRRLSSNTTSIIANDKHLSSLALSAFANSPKILRMTATFQQKLVLDLCENDNAWKRIISWSPTSLRSSLEKFREEYLLQFSKAHGQENEKNKNQKSDDKEKTESDDQNPDDARVPNPMFQLLTFFAVMYLILNSLRPRTEFIKWEDFVEKYLLTGEVEYITVDTKSNVVQAVVNKRHPFQEYRPASVTLLPSKEVSFENLLRELEDHMQLPIDQRMEIRYVSNNGSDWMSFLLNALVIMIIFGNFFRVTMRPKSKGGSSGSSGNQESPKMPPGLGPLFDPTQGMNRIRSALSSASPAEMKKATQGMTFKDVAGLKAAKQEVIEFVEYLKRSERYIRLGAKLPRGALLLGPPGCGKTLLVKALANEAGVPFFFMAGSEFVEVIGGVGASRMRKLFSEAREAAPSIIFIDEIDTIGRKRSGQATGGNSGFSEVEQTLNQLLVEMDGMDTDKSVIVFAATNRSEVLDRALLRPGRFDRIITIDLPTLEERREIFELHLSNYKLAKGKHAIAKKLANLTPGMTGADIANLCNEAALNAVRIDHTDIQNEDFDTALHRVLVGAEKKSRILSPKERERVASHEAGHAIVGWMLKNTDPLLRVSIVPRVVAALGYSQTAPQDKRLYSEDDLFDRMCMLIGGRVAELFYYKDLSSGAEDDLKRVTDMAYTQIRQLGMNSRVGHVSFDYSKEDHQYRLMPYSKYLQNVMDEEAKKLIQKVSQQTDLIIRENWESLDKIKNALLKKETLNYEDIVKLIGERPYGRKLDADDISWTNLSS